MFFVKLVEAEAGYDNIRYLYEHNMNFYLKEAIMTRDLMNLKDLSDYLQVPESKIKRLTDSDQIPHHDTLGTPRFFRTEIDAWIKSGRAANPKKVR